MKKSIFRSAVAKAVAPALLLSSQISFGQVMPGTPITTNYVPVFSATTPSVTVKNSQIWDNGTFVGIGGTSQIGGENLLLQKTTNAATFMRIYNNQAGTAAASEVVLTSNGATMGMAAYNSSYTANNIYRPATCVLNATGTGGMNIGTMGTSQLSLWTNNHQHVTVSGASTTEGFVGINNTSPTQMLHMNNGAILVQGTVPGVGGANILIGGTVGTQPYGQYGIEYETAADVGYAYGGLNFWKPFLSTGVNTNNILFLNDNGKVGVNTANPTAQLTVNGTTLIGDPATVTLPSGYKLYVQTGILTEKVKIALTTTSDWADYVFDKNYKLKSLEEVKSYIETNKHLPGVPSASELKEDGGIDMAKMAAKQMEKIEELTLYILQLEKQNKEMNERLLKLEASR